jgi:hypothetical protein
MYSAKISRLSEFDVVFLTLSKYPLQATFDQDETILPKN